MSIWRINWGKSQHLLPFETMARADVAHVSSSQSGASLVEVLIALVVFGLGSLALFNLQMSTMSGTRSSSFRSIATQQVQDIIERIRNNSDGFQRGLYLRQITAATPNGAANILDCDSVNCGAAELASYDQMQWLSAVKIQLPEASAAISCSDVDPSTASLELGTECAVLIAWNAPKAPKFSGTNTASLGCAFDSNYRDCVRIEFIP